MIPFYGSCHYLVPQIKMIKTLSLSMKNITFLLVFYLKFLGLEDKNLWLLISYLNAVAPKQKDTLFLPTV